MKKLVALLVAVVLYLLIGLNPAVAADLEVTCLADGCNPGSSAYFFPDSEIWTPGKTLRKTFKFNNLSGQTKNVAVRSANKVDRGSLDLVLDLYIRKKDSVANIWAGTINNFLTGGGISLASVNNGEDEEFEFTVSFDPSAGNYYQKSSLSFDLIFSYSNSAESPTPTETPVAGTSSAAESSPTPSPVAEITAYGIAAGTVAGETLVQDTQEPVERTEENHGQVAGAGISTKTPIENCNSSWWWTISLIQLIISILSVSGKNGDVKMKTAVLILAALASFITINLIFCVPLILTITGSAGILILALFLLYINYIKARENQAVISGCQEGYYHIHLPQ